MKRIFALLLAVLLAVGMTVSPALAADADAAPQMQAISPWAYDALADIYALGMWSDDYYYCILDQVTEEQLDLICAAVADKLALLNLAPNPHSVLPVVVDRTRGGVENALYQEAAAYDIPYVDADVDFMMGELGVVSGDGIQDYDMLNARACTLQEALVMATRLVLNVYDYYNAGSLGLLWKAEGNGVTLYLLGTVHVDRDNIYPFHHQLRSIITDADGAMFEVNLNDTQDMMAYSAMQMYQDGTTLKDHIDADLYAQVVQALTSLGMTEEQVAMYKPWALAATLQALAGMDESTGDSMMAMDVYVNAEAVNVGVEIGAAESFVYQGGIFDGLSSEYQEEYLSSALQMYQAHGQTDEPAQDLYGQYMDTLTDAWKTRDFDAFDAAFDKDAILAGDDELNARLFTERDPNMIQAAANILEGGWDTDGDWEKTYIMVVGAGHMVGSTGIVQGLRDLGYTVEAVPVP